MEELGDKSELKEVMVLSRLKAQSQSRCSKQFGVYKLQ